NMVAVGASSAVLHIDTDVFEEVVLEIFGRKGQQVVQKNMEAIKRGAEYIREQLGENLETMRLEPADGQKRMFMIGNDAIALG
ncbi:2-oxoacid:acceptor oxidoreductase family protein, partial [Escherichia coli]|nr:2-oxoacid:acceptor oxidoreductase family protein [Escherichia coli]